MPFCPPGRAADFPQPAGKAPQRGAAPSRSPARAARSPAEPSARPPPTARRRSPAARGGASPFPHPPPQPRRASDSARERHPTPAPPNPAEIRDRGNAARRRGGGGGRAHDFCLSFATGRGHREPPSAARSPGEAALRGGNGRPLRAAGPPAPRAGRSRAMGARDAPPPRPPAVAPGEPALPVPSMCASLPGGVLGKFLQTPPTKGAEAPSAAAPPTPPSLPTALTPGRARLAAQHRGGQEPQQQQERRRRLHVVPQQQLPERSPPSVSGRFHARGAALGGEGGGKGEAPRPALLLLLLLLRLPPRSCLPEGGWDSPARAAARGGAVRSHRPALCTWRGAAVRLGAARAFWRRSSVGFVFGYGFFFLHEGNTRRGREKSSLCVYKETTRASALSVSIPAPSSTKKSSCFLPRWGSSFTFLFPAIQAFPHNTPCLHRKGSHFSAAVQSLFPHQTHCLLIHIHYQ